jgi:hypothetical protein
MKMKLIILPRLTRDEHERPICPFFTKQGLKMSPMVGSCLIINSTHWRLEQRDNVKPTVDLSGPLSPTTATATATAGAAGAGGGWHTLSLAFDGDLLTAEVDGVVVGHDVPITSAWNGARKLRKIRFSPVCAFRTAISCGVERGRPLLARQARDRQQEEKNAKHTRARCVGSQASPGSDPATTTHISMTSGEKTSFARYFLT